MLAVPVEGDDRVEAILERQAEPGAQRGALALVGALDDHGRAGRLRLGRRRIRGPVVDDEDGKVGEHPAHDRSDPSRLVEGRDQDQDATRQRDVGVRLAAIHPGWAANGDGIRNPQRPGAGESRRPRGGVRVPRPPAASTPEIAG